MKKFIFLFTLLFSLPSFASSQCVDSCKERFQNDAEFLQACESDCNKETIQTLKTGAGVVSAFMSLVMIVNNMERIQRELPQHPHFAVGFKLVFFTACTFALPLAYMAFGGNFRSDMPVYTSYDGWQ